MHFCRRCCCCCWSATASTLLLCAALAAPQARAQEPRETPSMAVQNRIIADAIYKSGVQASRLGDYSRAIILLTKAVEMDPSLAECYRERGTAYLLRASAWEQIARATQALQNSPEATDALIDRAVAYYNVGDYQAASGDLTTVISLAPDLAEAYYRRGLVQMARGRYEQAAEDYRVYVSKRGSSSEETAPPPSLPLRENPPYRPDIL